VTKEAKEILRDYQCPEGTVLRLDSVNRHRQHDGFCVRLGAGLAKGDDQSNTRGSPCYESRGT
jgi:hypothetical protein